MAKAAPTWTTASKRETERPRTSEEDNSRYVKEVGMVCFAAVTRVQDRKGWRNLVEDVFATRREEV